MTGNQHSYLCAPGTVPVEGATGLSHTLTDERLIEVQCVEENKVNTEKTRVDESGL